MSVWFHGFHSGSDFPKQDQVSLRSMYDSQVPDSQPRLFTVSQHLSPDWRNRPPKTLQLQPLGDKDIYKSPHSQSHERSLQNRSCSRTLSIFGPFSLTLVQLLMTEAETLEAFPRVSVPPLCAGRNCYQNPPALPPPSAIMASQGWRQGSSTYKHSCSHSATDRKQMLGGQHT